jgi:hypothetical protein
VKTANLPLPEGKEKTAKHRAVQSRFFSFLDRESHRLCHILSQVFGLALSALNLFSCPRL